MSKMGSHDPFGYLKHKLWPKERPWVKLVIWLLTIKSRKSTWFPRVQVACDIPLKKSWQGLQCCFRLHCNRRFARKVMGPQIHENPKSRDKMSFECGSRGEMQKILWRGRWWLPPSLGCGESCESKFAYGSS
jgi:hypothetical protein